jgi:fumarylacetoacetase
MSGSAPLWPLDETHDPAKRSWVAAAQVPEADFPLQNLPFGRFSGGATATPSGETRLGVAIGDQVLDLARAGVWTGQDLRALMALPLAERRALRLRLSQGLREGAAQQAAWAEALVPLQAVQMHLPCEVGDYTDFYIGIHHARAVGRLFRPDQPLLPNYEWVPIGYHGRASTLVPSGQAIRRPCAQVKGPQDAVPRLAPTERLDLELELGVMMGSPNAQGVPVPLAQAESHVFGLVLLNDWSARDVQAWEYQPLGPFLSKSFATTLSPWVVTMEALAPFRGPWRRGPEPPAPLPYLDDPSLRQHGRLDVGLSVRLQTAQMRSRGWPGDVISRSHSAQAAYWSLSQMVAHHTVNGCALRPGDVLGTGTLSGPEPGQAGSLLELTQGGREPLALSTGEQRRFLEDGDSVWLSARCEREGYRGIGFGECVGTIAPAPALSPDGTWA